jgi:arginyl-tRNA synthetase
VKILIENLLRHALADLPEELVPAAARPLHIEVDSARDARHGDFASNLAMRLAKASGRNPRKLAEALVRSLPASPAVAKVEIAGAGFINFFLSKDAYHSEIAKVLHDGRRYGRSAVGAGRSVQVEFVSANPTGPLHVGHGRHAAFGATVANLLEAIGYRVEREYYINDAGRQMEILAASTWLRYLEQCGERFTFPANAYRGDYIADIAEQLFATEGTTLRRSAAEVLKNLPPDEPQGGDKDAYIDALIARARVLIGDDAFRRVLDLALAGILRDIREDLKEFGVTFDCWFSERCLSDDG